MSAPLQDLWEQSVGAAVPHASWLVRLDGEVVASRSPERRFSSASMIKTFILAAALAAAERGELVLDAPLAVEPAHRAAGDGVLAGMSLPLELPARDVLGLMAVVSDNTAANAVLARVGGPDALNAVIEGWGLGARSRGYLSGAGPAAAEADAITCAPELPSRPGIGICSPADHEGLIAAAASGRLLPSLGPQMLKILRGQQQRGALARWLAPEARFAHKAGAVDRVRHDGGLLVAHGRELLVHCFTDGGPREEWPGHPALEAMGSAMAWTVLALGLEVPLLPQAPRLPA